MKQKYIPIGFVQKSIGNKGLIRVELDENIEEDINRCGHLFVLINGDFVPFFLDKNTKIHNECIKLEEIDNPEEASLLVGKPIFLREGDVKSGKYRKKQEKLNLEGFNVIVEENCIGIIEKVESFPQQLMATIVGIDGQRFLIPLVDEWIMDLNRSKLSISMILPDGLI
jgi:16S rRNA processing protein RimM